MDHEQENEWPRLSKFVLSACAATVAELVTFPLDLTKTRLQIQGEGGSGLARSGKYRGMLRTAVGIAREEGPLKLWQGVTPALYRHMVYSGVRMLAYEQLRESVLGRSKDGRFPFWKAALGSMMAGALGQFIASPMDLVKVQMQMEGRRRLEGKPPSITKRRTRVQLTDFPSMKCNRSFIRRLITASSVTIFPLTEPTERPHTNWGWFWMNDSGGWTEYRQQGPFDFSFTSEVLEMMYQINSEQQVYFTSNKQKYLLRFKEMQQQNVESKKVREVWRRPRSDRRESPDSASADSIVPSYWDKDRLPSFSYEMVDLDTNSNEYSHVATLFKNTMSDCIYSVKRVQNLSLWKVFQWQKERMVNGNGGKAVDQRYLFHGTNDYQIDQICQQNIDWRLYGLNGARYGKGSYFARDASYSNDYVLPEQGIRKMILALVLVGEFTRGNDCLVRPPLKPNQSAYDSCVDDENSPSVFVIFEKFQIYPGYIIEYNTT